MVYDNFESNKGCPTSMLELGRKEQCVVLVSLCAASKKKNLVLCFYWLRLVLTKFDFALYCTSARLEAGYSGLSELVKLMGIAHSTRLG